MLLNRETFLCVLESIKYGLSKREGIQQGNCFIFRQGEICTFNGEICCHAPSSFPTELQGAALSEKLLETIRKIKDDELTIEHDDGTLYFSGKGKAFKIRYMPEIVLSFDDIKKPSAWKTLPDMFLEGINTVSCCANPESDHFRLKCVHVHPEWVEACDNLQMARYELITGFEKSFLVRCDGIKQIVSLGMCEYAEDPNWVHFRNPRGVIYSCRRYEEDYPDLSQFLVIENPKEISLPKELVEIIQIANIYSKDQLDTDFIHLKLKTNKLTITGRGACGDEYKEVSVISYKGPAIEFLISPKLLIELINKHSECQIASDRILIDGGSWKYSALLAQDEKDG